MNYQNLTTEQKQLVLQEVESEAKSTLVAYILFFFFGGLGIHNFYLGNSSAGATQAILTVVGYLTLALFIGVIPLLVVALWLLSDLFRIGKMVDQSKAELRETKAGIILSGTNR